jgi:hypothetical protein
MRLEGAFGNLVADSAYWNNISTGITNDTKYGLRLKRFQTIFYPIDSVWPAVVSTLDIELYQTINSSQKTIAKIKKFYGVMANGGYIDTYDERWFTEDEPLITESILTVFFATTALGRQGVLQWVIDYDRVPLSDTQLLTQKLLAS